MLTLAEENYLKAIYHVGKSGTVSVNTNNIAEQLQTKASSVTDMVKKLSEKDLVIYKKYQGAKLTDNGRKIAALVVRKHRLWEVFLVEHLNFSWDEVHEVAEQLEHIQSEKLINQLDDFLGYPKHDPHGDPIPDENGRVAKTDKILLSHVDVLSTCVCVGVNDSSAEFLQYLDKIGIALGTRIKVLFKEVFDESLTVEFQDRQINISKLVAGNLYVTISE